MVARHDFGPRHNVGMSKITDRIAARTGLARLAEVLSAEIPASDLQSLLLAVYQSRARVVREPELLARASSLTAPCNLDARRINEFDRVAFDTAAGFEAVELSPVCPFGSSFSLGGIDQNNVLTTVRNLEVFVV